MTRSLRGHIGLLALLSAAGSANAATSSLPPLRVDPALLGLTPAVSPAPQSSAENPSSVVSAPAVAPETPAASQLLPAPALQSPQQQTPISVLTPAPIAAPVPAPALAPATAVAPAMSLPESLADQLPAKVKSGASASTATPGNLPLHLVADRIDGTTNVETVAHGNAVMQRGERNLKADTLIYREPLDEMEATGNVKLFSPGELITGPHLKLKLGASTGSFDSPSYSLTGQEINDAPSSAHGKASRLDFEGQDRYRMHDATYSTCPASNSDPDWFARISDLSLDYTTSEGRGRGATVVFKGVPILYSPWLSFTLDNQRKTGLLSPTIGSTSKGGPEITTPFYLNIAPNMDATIAPRVMGKRGTQWTGDYRYLGQSYTGLVSGEYLERDKITHTNRSALSIQHNQDFGHGFTGSLNLNGVSDDTYFTDLSTRLSNITQTNLLREGRVNYGADWWSASLMLQRFQTLQDPLQAPVAIPYDRLPQLLVNADRPDLPFGLDMRFMGEYVDFNNPTGNAVEGKRITFYPQLAYPMQTAAFYVTPKIGFHSTQYQLHQQAAGVPDRISRSVPIFSVDSGMVFERPLQLFNQSLTQTLEPRAYYLKVPQRDQSLIPVFDSGIADFNFAQIFSENAYSGGDRISDANQLTLAATSRVIDTSNGEELLRGAVGQRYYFADQTVTIPGVAPRTRRLADLLAALSGKLNREISFDSGVQYNTQDSAVERLNFGGRYQPEPGKVINAGYRYTRSLLRQVDTSAQWPLFGGWHAVGRYNYSFRDKRVIESIAGLEYDGGCWATRFVVQRLATAVGQVNNSIFVQLELNGFSQIGSDPLDLLKRNVPGYGRISGSAGDPVFAE